MKDVHDICHYLCRNPSYASFTYYSFPYYIKFKIKIRMSDIYIIIRKKEKDQVKSLRLTSREKEILRGISETMQNITDTKDVFHSFTIGCVKKEHRRTYCRLIRKLRKLEK